jgi:DNA mismatch repair protein MutS
MMDRRKIFRLYTGFKRKKPDLLFLFRMGDTYNAFYGDAILLSRWAGFPIDDWQGIPHCTMPVFTAQALLRPMTRNGFDIGVCVKD